MASFEIYGVEHKKRKWTHVTDIKNAFGAAVFFWVSLEDKYLPLNIGLSNEHITRLLYKNGEKANEIWNLYANPNLTEAERLVLFCTFDKKYLLRKNIPAVVEAMKDVHKNLLNSSSMFEEIANALEIIYKENKYRLVAFNMTSVCTFSDTHGDIFDKNKISDLYADYITDRPK